MKTLFSTCSLLLFAFISYSQKKEGFNNGYGNVGLVVTSAHEGGIGANFAAGTKITDWLAAGIGFDAIKMNNYRKWRTAMFGEVRGIVYKGIYITGQGGYSFFNSTETIGSGYTAKRITTEGGIYYAGGIGYSMPKKKVSPYICIKVANYPHTETISQQVRITQTQYKTVVTNADYSEMAGTLTLGVKF